MSAARAQAPEGIAIRRVTPDDNERLEVEVDRARLAGEFAASSEPGGAFFMKSVSIGHPVAAAFDADGGVAGFVSPEFKVVTVRPADRRRGIGRALVEAAVEIERERGRPNVLIGALPADDAARAFLGATGFAFHSTVWELELPPGREVDEPLWPGWVTARQYDRTRDARPFLELFNAAFADHATPLQLDLAAIEASNGDPSVDDGDTLLVADEAGRLVGFCSTHPQRRDGVVGRHGEVSTIGVLPEHQGKGLGRQLLRWGVRRLRSIGPTEVSLSVNGRNQGALGLYEREGFERVRTRDRWARPVGPA